MENDHVTFDGFSPLRPTGDCRPVREAQDQPGPLIGYLYTRSSSSRPIPPVSSFQKQEFPESNRRKNVEYSAEKGERGSFVVRKEGEFRVFSSSFALFAIGVQRECSAASSVQLGEQRQRGGSVLIKLIKVPNEGRPSPRPLRSDDRVFASRRPLRRPQSAPTETPPSDAVAGKHEARPSRKPVETGRYFIFFLSVYSSGS